MANGNVPSPGERWRRGSSGAPWRVVSVHEGSVAMSGPGPCRSMKYVSDTELHLEWERVEAANVKR